MVGTHIGGKGETKHSVFLYQIALEQFLPLVIDPISCGSIDVFSILFRCMEHNMAEG